MCFSIQCHSLPEVGMKRYLSITIHCCAGGWSGNVGAIGTRGLMLTAYEMMFDLPARRIQACWYSIHSTASAAHRAALNGMIDHNRPTYIAVMFSSMPKKLMK